MIELTRLNRQVLSLNADLIKYVEQAPDTVITLVTGEKLVVAESADEVVRRVIRFRRLLLADLYCGPRTGEPAKPQPEGKDPES